LLGTTLSTLRIFISKIRKRKEGILMFNKHQHHPIIVIFLVLAFAFLLLSNPKSAFDSKVLALENGLARTPPMGWNSWNIFGGSIDETKIKGIADALVSSGMKDAGYIYLNLDDNWMKNPARDANGYLVCDPTRFPSGLKSLGDYIHGKGLKFGIYSDRGTMTCMGIPQSGGHNNEVKDANTYASWTVDYLKYDNCNADSDIQADYERMRDALANCGRPICFSICSWSYNGDWMINCGNLWRTTGDISNSFSSMLGCYDTNVGLASKAGPGHWNDPDMLEIGNGGLNDTENRSHMSLWCIMAAPLIAGNDIRSMSQATKDILCAPEVIAVDQDVLGKQGVKVRDDGNSEVISKQMNDGSRVVALLNRASTAANITVSWTEIGLSTGNATVRDLWARADAGVFANSYTANVASHATVLVKISGTVAPTTTPVPTATPTITPSPVPGTTYLSDLTWASSTNGWGPVEKNLSNGEQGTGDGTTIKLNGTTYTKGLGCHAAAEVIYNLGGSYSTFISDVGLDDEVDGKGTGTVTFEVWLDGTKAYDSGVMSNTTTTKNINLNIAGKNQLRLVLTNGGDTIDYDHADWAGARVIMGTAPTNTPTPTPGATATPTPTPAATATPSPTPASSSYEAESSANTLGGGARIMASAGCSGGNKVGWVGNGDGTNNGTLQFNNVNAASAGSKTLTVYYCSGEARTTYMSVNGGAGTSASYASTGGYDAVGTKTFTITLNAGNNTIKLYNDTGWAPDFDRITVQ
jgi:alpha-galactosidase